MPKFYMVNHVYGTPKGDGGTCEQCLKSRSVIYVSELDKFLCTNCLAGDQPARDEVEFPRGSREERREAS